MKNIIFKLIILILLPYSCDVSPKQSATKTALLITGNDHPAHKWQETTPVIKSVLESDSIIRVIVSQDPEDLQAVSKEKYDLIILNYCNWEDSAGISEEARKGFMSYLEEGGGLLVLHFSNGAFHFSLPGARESDWPEYRNIVHQVWDHNRQSTHDPFGAFKVEIDDAEHFITKGLLGFETLDELYYNQVGETELPALYSAVSAQSGKQEPLAWAYFYKNARVFQSLLGHGPESYDPPEYREILRRAAIWVTEL